MVPYQIKCYALLLVPTKINVNSLKSNISPFIIYNQILSVPLLAFRHPSVSKSPSAYFWISCHGTICILDSCSANDYIFLPIVLSQIELFKLKVRVYLFVYIVKHVVCVLRGITVSFLFYM